MQTMSEEIQFVYLNSSCSQVNNVSILRNILLWQLCIYYSFTLFDIRVYTFSSCAFYVLLKGRRDKAFYHSSRKDFLEKKRITKQYFYTQIFSLFSLFIIQYTLANPNSSAQMFEKIVRISEFVPISEITLIQ